MFILGRCYLYMKTIERAHMPAKLWEKIPLSKDYAEAVKQASRQLILYLLTYESAD